MQIQVTTTVTGEMLGNAMCSAVEGGSTYWCSKMRTIPASIGDGDKYSHWYYDAKFWEDETCSIAVWDSEDEDKRHVVTREMVTKGVQTMAEKYPDHFKDLVTMEGDANTGDVLLQCIVFGELIYG
jgi:hypothetical protein